VRIESERLKTPNDAPQPTDARVIVPSLSRRFSGINATLNAVTPEIARQFPIVATGTHIDAHVPKITFRDALRLAKSTPPRIWHARRNVEMLVGLILRHVLRYPILLLWTSAALRRHSWITRFYYRRMDAIIATTRKAAGFLEREAHVVYHGVNVGTFHPPDDPADARRRKQLPGKRNLGIFGRVRPSKGTGDLVDALCEVFPKHPDWGAVIIGQTTEEFRLYEMSLRKKLQAAGIENRVQFIGFIPDSSQIPGWYQALDLVVCASRSEGFGLPCLEAMASGCPVVATTAGAWPEIVSEGQDGWLAQAANPDDLARALSLALSADADTLVAMGQRARGKVIHDFTIEREARGIIAVYQGLLDAR
jgi:mannosyltransferase